jgi:hypothetical protein
VIVQAQERLRGRYLTQIANAVRSKQISSERVSRAIASHLLDTGFSSDFLHRWWSYRLIHEAKITSLADIIDESAQLALSKPRMFEVLAPIANAVQFGMTAPPAEWRMASDVAKWLRDHKFDTAGVRQDGGFIFNVKALDSGAAATAAAEIVERLGSRMAVGTKRSLAFLDRFWIRGEREPFRIDPIRRGVWVEAIERENQLYSLHSSGSIDAAIELLSHLQVSSPSAAVAGGWAAVEALLSEPNDRGGAAERLAQLVACSFPRAELTLLSYRLSRIDFLAFDVYDRSRSAFWNTPRRNTLA